jgi:hypothetical protein
MLVGIGQRDLLRLRYRCRSLPSLAASPPDFPQRAGRPQLAKQHGDKLAPAGETAGVPLGVVLPDCFLEFDSWEQLKELSKNAAYSIHGGSLLGFGFRSCRPKLQATGASA